MPKITSDEVCANKFYLIKRKMMSDIEVLSKNDIAGLLYEITYLISYV